MFPYNPNLPGEKDWFLQTTLKPLYGLQKKKKKNKFFLCLFSLNHLIPVRTGVSCSMAWRKSSRVNSIQIKRQHCQWTDMAGSYAGYLCFPRQKTKIQELCSYLSGWRISAPPSFVYNGFNFAKWFNTLASMFMYRYTRQPYQRNLTDCADAPLQDVHNVPCNLSGRMHKMELKRIRSVMGVSAGGIWSSFVNPK